MEVEATLAVTVPTWGCRELAREFAADDRAKGLSAATVELAAGDVLFEQGTMGELIYIVSEGELEIMRELPGGGEEMLKLVEAGDYFGEFGPLFHLPRSATARARTDAVVVGYTVQAFRERLGSGTREIIEHRPLPGDEPAED